MNVYYKLILIQISKVGGQLKIESLWSKGSTCLYNLILKKNRDVINCEKRAIIYIILIL